MIIFATELQKYELFLERQAMTINNNNNLLTRGRKNRLLLALILLIASGLCLPVAAQEPLPDPEGGKETMQRETLRWDLAIGSGNAYGVYRDMGTAPVRYKGIGLVPSVSAHYTDTLWRIGIETRTGIGLYENAVPPLFNFEAYDIYNIFEVKALRRIWRQRCDDNGNWRLWAGAGFGNFCDFTVNSNYENASLGVSELIGLELTGRGEWHWRRRLWLHGEATVMAIGSMLRPGYSYIDNYTATQPVLSAQFDEYQWHTGAFPLLATNLGIDFHLNNGNRLSLSYLWHYATSGNGGNWRYDSAAHALLAEITINLKTNKQAVALR